MSYIYRSLSLSIDSTIVSHTGLEMSREALLRLHSGSRAGTSGPSRRSYRGIKEALRLALTPTSRLERYRTR
jgi:hypothetical protein